MEDGISERKKDVRSRRDARAARLVKTCWTFWVHVTRGGAEVSEMHRLPKMAAVETACARHRNTHVADSADEEIIIDERKSKRDPLYATT